MASLIIYMHTYSPPPLFFYDSEYNPLHLAFLLELGDHDDDGAALVPDHLPEVHNGVRHGALCRYVGLWLTFISLTQRRDNNLNTDDVCHGVLY